MSDAIAVTETPALSQGMRFVDTFVAPSKTFTDIRRSAMCWLPILWMIVLSLGWCAAIDKTVGFQTATANQMEKSPAQADAMQQLPADQRAQRMAVMVKWTRYSMYGSAVFVLIFMLIEALVLWAAFNFGLGAATKFSQVFAVISFAALPRTLIWLLSAVLLFAGVGTDNFDMRNPVGTNLGYYLQDSAKWMSTAGSFFDFFGLWSLTLVVIGMAIIARKKVSQSAMIVVGLWVLALFIVTGFSAAFS